MTTASELRPHRSLCFHRWAPWIEIISVFAVGVSVVLMTIKLYGQNLLAQIVGVWIANLLMLTLIQAGLYLRGQPWSHLGLQFRSFGIRRAMVVLLQSLVAFVAAILFFVFGAILMANLVGMPEPADMSKYAYLQGNLPLTIAALASVYFVSSFAEEVIYRGFLITRISESGKGRTAVWAAVLLSSIVFGAVHSDWGIAGMVQASLMGLALGISFLRFQRNLWVTILAHGYMDTILVLQMYAGAS